MGNINGIVASACLAIFALSTQAATSVSNLTDLSREIGQQQMSLPITPELDADCKKSLSSVMELRVSNVTFAIDANTVEAYPAWPLVCSYVAVADSVQAHRTKQGDIELSFSIRTEKKPILRILLQRVDEEDQAGGADYMLVGYNGYNATPYSHQKFAMNQFLNNYRHVVGL